VFVNVTDLGSHAILISSSAIKTLELSKFTASEIRSWLTKEWRATRENFATVNREFQKFLSWLWQTCVREVLVAGQFRIQGSKTALPRIWWIGSGLTSSIPFHAAGNHSPGSRMNCFQRIVSSYTPSIKALAYSQQRLRKLNTAEDGFLLTTMMTTPELPDLDGVKNEKEEILKVVPSHLRSKRLDNPDSSRVLECLKHYTIAHFACHGCTSLVDPSKGGLIFQKEDDTGYMDWDVMTIQDLSVLNLNNAKIAYLSACSTANNGAVGLQDEAIHLVSGFQIAGFAHVIGCLWPSADSICVEIAKVFYESFFQKEKAETDNKNVALALQESVAMIRAIYGDQPLKWAQFVHFGA
jgi:CHAT domain-containing protein